MAKRSAASDLNHDNWDAEDEKEDPGKFTALSASELKNRVIRKAKRSLNSSATGTSSAASSPFAKFSGFSTNTASSPFFSAASKTSSPFSAAASKTENTADHPFQISQKSTASKNSLGSFFSTTKKIKEETPNGKTQEDKNSEDIPKPAPLSGESSKVKSRGVEYCKHLKNLNESVVKWMQKYLDKNACCDFTPVFTDYKKHMDSLNMKYPVREVETISQLQGADVFKKTLSSDDNSNSTEQPKFKVEPKKQKDETDYGAHFSSNTTNTSTFSFGINKTPTATSSNSPLYSNNSSSKEGASKSDKEETKPFTAGFFGQSDKGDNKETSRFSAGFFGQNNKDDNKGTSQFSAGFFSKPFQSSGDNTFSFATAPVEKSADGDKEEAEAYVPPKNEFVAVSEEGAVYSKRCKLFFKKEDSFADKGVGTLYVKSLEDTTQLLVRADTNLGNILLNIRLSASIPISRSGKNNVMIACIPNPPVDPKNPDKAIPMLIRVKTSEDADELLETLNKYKL